MNNTKTAIQESLSELLRRSEITSKARYTAARRMELHSAFSQWTLAFLAVGQLVISLVVALKLHTNFPPSYVDFGGIFFGILVLTYSLLLGMGNYAARSIMLHSCGVELGALSRDLHFKSRDESSSKDDYKDAAAKYYEILSRCENHLSVDYLEACADASKNNLDGVGFFSSEHLFYRWTKLKRRITIWMYKTFQFFHYGASISLISSWIYMLSAPAAV
jgi:hypothetical protein